MVWGILRSLAPLLLIAAAAVHADERVPARFGSGERSLAGLIGFPELRGDATATLRCAARVDRDGELDDNGCALNTAGDEVYVSAINEAAQRARMTPARVDGRPLAVYVQYRVAFEKTGDEETITVYNNPGVAENIEAYGADHIAAQRGLTDEAWLDICPRRTPFLVWAKAHVARDGQQSNVSLVHGKGAPLTENCRAAILKTLQESVFIPAYADGEPVPSAFVEPFGN